LGVASQPVFRVFSAFLIAMACAGPLNAAREWRKLATPRYTIFTHASDHLTRDMASDFDEFLGVVDRFVIIEPENLKPLTVVLFADDSEFNPYKPLAADGRNIDDIPAERLDVRMGSETSGLFGWTTIAVAAQDYEHQTRHALFGGGVYWHLDALRMPMNPAVAHGTAMLLSTFRREITHGELGLAPPRYVSVLDKWDLIPVKQLLTMRLLDAVASDTRVRFNAESWALVHYLMFSKWAAQRHAFSTFWEALRDGVAPDDALVKALGPDGAASIDIDLRSYIHSSRYLVKIPLGPRVENRNPIVPADPMEVEIALTRAAMGGRRTPGALAHANAAVAAANGRPEAYDIRAEAVAFSKASDADVDKAVDEALAHGSRDGWTVCQKAISRFGRIADPAASQQELRAVIDLAEQAANLNPRLRSPFNLLAKAVAFSDHVTANDAKLMAFAQSHFPADRWILIGQSAIYAKNGDVEKAQQLRNQALSDDIRLDPHQLPAIRAFLASVDRAGQPHLSAGGSRP
jgi:hypothetical protein